MNQKLQNKASKTKNKKYRNQTPKALTQKPPPEFHTIIPKYHGPYALTLEGLFSSRRTSCRTCWARCTPSTPPSRPSCTAQSSPRGLRWGAPRCTCTPAVIP